MRSEASTSSLSCPSCGAPFSDQILDEGKERCAFCDVLSLCTPERPTVHADHELTRLERSVGKVRRYGTVALAPFLGVSVFAILNFGRHFRSSESAIELSIFVGTCILALLWLRRRIVAAVWTLFFCLALLNERAVAYFPVAPNAHFSFTSEVSLMPFIACAATFGVFVLVFWSSETLAHEQQKLTWRWSVAVTFVLGLGAGAYVFTPPYTTEVHRGWAWAHAQEAGRVLALRQQLDAFAEHATTPLLSVEPRPRWTRRKPDQSNVAFLPYAAISRLPDLALYQLEADQRGELVGHYAWNFQNAEKSSHARAYFSPVRAREGWRAAIEGPLTAPWLVIYDIQPQHTRYWLIRRVNEIHYDVGPPPSKLEIVAYRSSHIETGVTLAASASPSAWILESLRDLTGGEFN